MSRRGLAIVIVAIVVLEAGAAGGAAPLSARSQVDAHPSFAEWLTGVRAEALDRGIRPDVVDQALGNIDEPLPVVLDRDRRQAESVLPLETYISRRLTRTVVTTGQQMLARHKSVLDEIAAKYGVPAGIIVAIWGVESNFGRFSGIRPTLPALATLAWDPRRATFFRGELFDALEILNRGDIEIENMRGSWAGAMGQAQFMPSSYLRFAEDFDGDGRRDIWHSSADIFASIANYLKGAGWASVQRWGREVSVSKAAAEAIAADVARRAGSCQAMRNMTVALPLAEWARLGVRAANGKTLPAADISAAMVSGASRHFLVYSNYDALLAYNCAHAYAVSVALLADRLTGSTATVTGSDPHPPTKKKNPAARQPTRERAARQ
jgi:membrane-bound lytic murein transglycosylase B